MFGTWNFCEGNCGPCPPEYGRTWVRSEYVIEYCMIDTEEDAEMVLNKILEKYKGSNVRVVKVIKKVKV